MPIKAVDETRVRHRCRLRFGFRRDDVQVKSWPRRASSSARFSDAVKELPGAGPASTSGRSSAYRDNYLRHAEQRPCSPTAASCYIPKDVQAVRWSCPLTSASTPSQHRPVRADTDRRRRGVFASATWRAAPPLMRDENQLACSRGRAGGSDGQAPRSSTARSKTGTPATLNHRQGRHLQLRHQARQVCKGVNSKISWTQVETGSAITWKYPSRASCTGDNSGRRVLLRSPDQRPSQQADTGTKMIHLGKNTRSTIVSKGISRATGQNTTAAW